LKHLITLLEDLQALGISFVSLAEGIDATTPAGRLQMHLLGAIAEFERARIVERVRAGLARARAQGKRLGRPRRVALDVEVPEGLTVRQAAKQWGVSKSTAARRLTSGQVPI
jgi:DNA invertase Pin-like site-specific DNA recombinase